MIPTNIITGFLGVGKTTAVLDLLRQRSPGERWGVLVNEFGDVAIDQIPFADRQDGNIVVREVSGGCICCTAGATGLFAASTMCPCCGQFGCALGVGTMGIMGGLTAAIMSRIHRRRHQTIEESQSY